MASGDPILSNFGGQVRSQSSVYATARDGGGNMYYATNGSELALGASLSGVTYSIYEVFLGFDTSGIPDDATILSVELSLWVSEEYSAQAFELRAYEYDYGAVFTSADFRTADQLAALTQVASKASTAFAAGDYATFASDDAFKAAINRTGATKLVIATDRMEAGSAPNGYNELVIVYSHLWTGTDKDPKLVVTYGDAAAPSYLPGVMRHHFYPPLVGGR